jgi:hypothetical protein
MFFFKTASSGPYRCSSIRNLPKNNVVCWGLMPTVALPVHWFWSSSILDSLHKTWAHHYAFTLYRPINYYWFITLYLTNTVSNINISDQNAINNSLYRHYAAHHLQLSNFFINTPKQILASELRKWKMVTGRLGRPRIPSFKHNEQ